MTLLISSSRRTNMPYYRKKPIAIEARQYTGDIFEETYEEM